MKKYFRIHSSETVFYENEVEAKNEAEAIKIVKSGIIDFDYPVDGEDFNVNYGEEISEEEYLFTSYKNSRKKFEQNKIK